MIERRIRFPLVILACFAALEAGALVVCIGWALMDGGLRSAWLGIPMWLVIHPFVLMIIGPLIPFGIFLRWLIGLKFEPTLSVALWLGGCVGLSGGIYVKLTMIFETSEWFAILAIGLFAGMVGAWVWWLVEDYAMRRRNNVAARHEPF